MPSMHELIESTAITQYYKYVISRSFGTFLELPVPLGRILVVVVVVDRDLLALRNVSTRYDTHDEPVSRVHWGLQKPGVGLIWRKAI